MTGTDFSNREISADQNIPTRTTPLQRSSQSRQTIYGGQMGETEVNDDAATARERPSSTISHVLHNFTPLWFSISMDTGIISILLHQLPYQFRGLSVISIVVYLLNLCLFVVFLAVFAARMICYPRDAVKKFGSQVDELAGLACPVVAYLTLVAMTSMVTGQAWTSSWAIFGYVLWCISAFLALLVVFLTFYISYLPCTMKPNSGQLTQCTTVKCRCISPTISSGRRNPHRRHRRRHHRKLHARNSKDGRPRHNSRIHVRRHRRFLDYHSSSALLIPRSHERFHETHS